MVEEWTETSYAGRGTKALSLRYIPSIIITVGVVVRFECLPPEPA